MTQNVQQKSENDYPKIILVHGFPLPFSKDTLGGNFDAGIKGFL